MKEETLTPKVMILNVTLKKTDVDSFPCDKDYGKSLSTGSVKILQLCAEFSVLTFFSRVEPRPRTPCLEMRKVMIDIPL